MIAIIKMRNTVNNPNINIIIWSFYASDDSTLRQSAYIYNIIYAYNSYIKPIVGCERTGGGEKCWTAAQQRLKSVFYGYTRVWAYNYYRYDNNI